MSHFSGSNGLIRYIFPTQKSNDTLYQKLLNRETLWNSTLKSFLSIKKWRLFSVCARIVESLGDCLTDKCAIFLMGVFCGCVIAVFMLLQMDYKDLGKYKMEY